MSTDFAMATLDAFRVLLTQDGHDAEFHPQGFPPVQLLRSRRSGVFYDRAARAQWSGMPTPVAEVVPYVEMIKADLGSYDPRDGDTVELIETGAILEIMEKLDDDGDVVRYAVREVE